MRLAQIAGRRTMPIPAELLIRHTLALPGRWDWRVRRAAFEAILRRLASARGQEIAVAEGPGRGTWGRYLLTRSDAEGTLPYDVRLSSLAPVHGSCDCADYLRASLGFASTCWPSWTHLGRKPRAFQEMLRSATSPAVRRPAIVWDATRATPGAADPCEGLGLVTPAANQGSNGHSPVPPSVGRLFGPSSRGTRRLRTTHADDPGARLRLVRTIEDRMRSARVTRSIRPLGRCWPRSARGWIGCCGCGRRRPGCSGRLAGRSGACTRTRRKGCGGSSPRAGWCSPTTWASARRPRRLWPPVPCSGPVWSSGGCWWSRLPSSRNGSASGRRCPTPLCKSWKAAPTIAAASTRRRAGASW